MLKLYIGRNAGRTVCLTLPASYEEVDKALTEFGDARPEAPVLIQEARTSVPPTWKDGSKDFPLKKRKIARN